MSNGSTTYIIPINAPLPEQLKHLSAPTGTFATRIAAVEESQGVLALSPIEMAALAKTPEVFNLKDVTVLMEIPGAYYDPLFEASAARYGARVVHWPMLEAEMKRQHTEAQRTQDKAPWAAMDQESEPRAKLRAKEVDLTSGDED